MALIDLNLLKIKNRLLYKNWEFINDVVKKYEWIEVQSRHKPVGLMVFLCCFNTE